jgi:2-polyprenyl-3-methyl-5-hydroxy-6-metoxy-1,4-benzoquinol methylase
VSARPAPRQPIGESAGLKELLALYPDASLGFRAFLAHRWWHASMPAVEEVVIREGTILDLGCGHGIFANLMGLRAPGRRILALEKNAEKAALARGRVTNVTVEDRDILDEDFPTVDAVTLIDVLHHLDSYDQQVTILDAVDRILPKGGQLVLKEVTRSRKLRFRLTYGLDRLAYPKDTFYFRRHEEFLKLLEERGYAIDFRPLWKHVPYAHYVAVATK